LIVKAFNTPFTFGLLPLDCKNAHTVFFETFFCAKNLHFRIKRLNFVSLNVDTSILTNIKTEIFAHTKKSRRPQKKSAKSLTFIKGRLSLHRDCKKQQLKDHLDDRKF